MINSTRQNEININNKKKVERKCLIVLVGTMLVSTIGTPMEFMIFVVTGIFFFTVANTRTEKLQRKEYILLYAALFATLALVGSILGNTLFNFINYT